jgi:hypothetical protein
MATRQRKPDIEKKLNNNAMGWLGRLERVGAVFSPGLGRVAHHVENLAGREAFFGDDAEFLQVFQVPAGVLPRLA